MCTVCCVCHYFTYMYVDSIVVMYDSVAKTLSFGKNGDAPNVAFHDVVKQGRDLYPLLLFPRRHSSMKVTEKASCPVRFLAVYWSHRCNF